MFGDNSAARTGLTGSTPLPAGGPNDPFARRDATPAFDLAEYWRLAVKHRLLIIASVIAAAILGVVATLLMTPVYTAAATLQIDREADRVLNVADVQPRESLVAGEEFFQTQYGLLRSRTLTDRVIRSLGLASSDEFLRGMGVTPPDTKGDARQVLAERNRAVTQAVQRNLGIAPVRGSRLVTISFNSPDPILSARVVNAFADEFIQSNLDRKYESSRYAREFLETRIAQTKVRLGEAERELVDYARREQIINIREPGQASGEPQSLPSSNLSALNTSLIETRAARVAAEEKWRQMRSAPLLSIPEVYQNQAVQQLTAERARVQAEYEQKSANFRPEYPEMVQLRARLEELDSQINSVASGIRQSVGTQYTVLVNQERALDTRVNALKDDVLDLRNRSVQYGILQREVDTSRSLYDALLQRYNEVGVTGGVTANNISIVDPAEVPNKPSKPRPLLNLALALLLGLGFGIAAALLIEALDETLASPDDVESKLGVSVLGVIPLLEKGQSPREALDDIRSTFSEAYYSLRTVLQFSTPNGTPTTLLVTSSRPAEGKSTTAYATALNLSRLGRRVLLVDGDLRNPSMHRVVGVENNEGMSNLLSGHSQLTELVKATGQEGLDFIPCGPIPPNPAELWGGDRLQQVLQEAAARYSHIVIDGPPVLGFADSPLLAAAVQGTIFVLESKGTRRAQARGALRRLAIGNGRILGVVLTKFNTKTVHYGGYDYAYDYDYGSREEGRTSRKRG
jgi:polysaccharide biosynthesis transport protein